MWPASFPPLVRCSRRSRGSYSAWSLSTSLGRALSRRPRLSRCVTGLLILTMGLFFVAVLALPGCATQERISIARATRLPAEVAGFARVMQSEPVKIGIVGTDTVAAENIAGYIVVHEQDLAQLLRNTDELLALKAKPPGATR